MPVPQSRTDAAYFVPSKELRLVEETGLCLGLVHPFDTEGTRSKIEVVGRFVKNFGVATECGMGRMRGEVEFESGIQVLKAVTTAGMEPKMNLGD